MKRSPIYTRTGDSGMTSLVGGRRVPKNSPRVCAYGAVDELNAIIGLLRAHSDGLGGSVTGTLLRVSNTLFDIGAYLATPSCADGEKVPPMLQRLSDELPALEHMIDLLDSEVPELRQFILPGGSTGAAHAHVARTVCRRAEREILSLADTGEEIAPVVLNYINRLSDYLFVLARYINMSAGIPDTPWQK